MKDIKRFKKLFDIKMPCDEHFDYYISVLSKTHNHSNIHEIIKMYEQAESEYENFNDWSHRKSNDIIAYLKSTITYQKMINDSHPNVSYNKKPYKAEVGKRYLSIDLSKANWQVFKYYDETSELPDTYDELLDTFGCPEVLKYSKNYRQFIFGHLNPKRQQSVEASMMQSMMMFLEQEGIKHKMLDFKHDEVILTDYDDSIFEAVKSLKYKFRLEEFEPRVVDNIKVYEYYKLGTDEVSHKKLFGSPGNRRYIDLKKYVLNEPIELRDLYFRDNGSLALWADDTDLLKSLLDDERL